MILCSFAPLRWNFRVAEQKLFSTKMAGAKQRLTCGKNQATILSGNEKLTVTMHWFGIIIILFLGGIWIVGSIYSAFHVAVDAGIRRWKRWVKVVGFGLMALGAAGFFGIALSATGGLNWLPQTCEWPAGSAKGVLVMPNGEHVIPLRAAGRIQVYDSAWKFLRGWYVDAYAGTFEIQIFDTNRIEVLTARGDMRYLYSLSGSLLSKGTYASQNYADFHPGAQSVIVPTHWWLWTFTGPFYSWAVAMLGLAMQFLGEPKTKLERTYRPSI
jgi:hypothetical protein